jgi:hypothetical protein
LIFYSNNLYFLFSNHAKKEKGGFIMERAVVSTRPEKLNEIKEALEKEISDDMSLEVAIVVYGPPEKLMNLSLKAMCKGAISVSRI